MIWKTNEFEKTLIECLQGRRRSPLCCFCCSNDQNRAVKDETTDWLLVSRRQILLMIIRMLTIVHNRDLITRLFSSSQGQQDTWKHRPMRQLLPPDLLTRYRKRQTVAKSENRPLDTKSTPSQFWQNTCHTWRLTWREHHSLDNNLTALKHREGINRLELFSFFPTGSVSASENYTVSGEGRDVREKCWKESQTHGNYASHTFNKLNITLSNAHPLVPPSHPLTFSPSLPFELLI